MTDNTLYSTTDVAERAQISRDTLLRWLKSGKIEEPDRNRNGWRVFTEAELEAVLRYANKVIPSPRKRQRSLQLKSTK